MHSAPPIGTALANLVADRLERGSILAYQHRDYCGVGLRFGEQRYIYGEVNDGVLPLPSECKYWQEAGDIEKLIFASRADFIAWLAEQTDESLSGRSLSQTWLHDNQRLTRARLEAFGRGGQ